MKTFLRLVSTWLLE